ncbi:hypothetical protein HDU79_000709 [Rhizoclosmatium sp. JEL0117]|nr:hypothetical protein HDU79_000709 [Rhizoclosmatium sp. JEL0117]
MLDNFDFQVSYTNSTCDTSMAWAINFNLQTPCTSNTLNPVCDESGDSAPTSYGCASEATLPSIVTALFQPKSHFIYKTTFNSTDCSGTVLHYNTIALNTCIVSSTTSQTFKLENNIHNQVAAIYGFQSNHCYGAADVNPTIYALDGSCHKLSETSFTLSLAGLAGATLQMGKSAMKLGR